jgi:SpoIID/LytB domain protein
MSRASRSLVRLLAGVVVLGLATSIVASGATIQPAGAATQIVITGHGWGHGRGMGQYGAYGYATAFGWNHQQILDHFYGGTTMGALAPGQPMRVRLTRRDNQYLGVTSNAPFVVGGVVVDPTRAVWIRQESDGRFHAFVAFTCTGDAVWDWYFTDGYVSSAVPDPGNNLGLMLTICGDSTYRGRLQLVSDAGALRTVNELDVESYLRGVVPREVPAGWPAAAVQAQAVAARSYGWSENRYWYAKSCDTTACQVYGGAGRDGVPLEHPASDAAIAATSGQVRVVAGGAVARTEFSSSTGGWTAGGTFPPVQDLGDATPANPNRTWQAVIPVESVESRYGIGTFQAIEITQRNGLGDWGGRVLQLRIRGSAGTVARSGDQVRTDWGLKSNWFTIGDPFMHWWLRNATAAGGADVDVTYGMGAWNPVPCDWNADGADTLGVYDNGRWYLKNSNVAGPPDAVLDYGYVGFSPVCGDWDGDGHATIGVFVNGWWLLRNSNWPGPADLVIAYGAAGHVPVVGDWDGDGDDTIGVFAGGRWLLRNSNSPGFADFVFDYGLQSYVPVAGDWDGDGDDTPGVYVGGHWILRNSNSAGPGDYFFDYGWAGAAPIVGDWDGIGGTGVGVIPPPTA